MITRSGLHAGDRAPDVQLANGDWLSDQLRGYEWKLLLFGNAGVNVSQRIKIITANDQKLVEIYGLSEGMVLIRPDGYIALITPASDHVHHYFHQFRCLPSAITY